ncbi:MAG: hypothetical protein ACTTKP_08205 [Catonella sp.]|uniref:hypothetical protein n=1 Tax=Catonella sp. TaxID=2382125 RepID=UPI003F9F36B0
MEMIGINTGSGYNAYAPRGSVGGSGQEKIRVASVNTDIGTKTISDIEKQVSVDKTPLENQVAVSQDGDTLQISPKAAAKFEAEIKEVQNKEEASEAELRELGNGSEADKQQIKNEETENLRKEARLKAEKRAEVLKELAEMNQKKEVKIDEKQNVSFSGKSDSDITRLYLEGEITKSDYDSEMSSREKLRTQVAKKDNDFINKTVEGDKIEKKLERFSKDLRTAFSDETSKTFDAVTRLDAIDAAEGTKKAENEKKPDVRSEVKFSYK